MKKSIAILFLSYIVSGYLRAQVVATPVVTDSTVLAFVSDTQSPLWIESIFGKTHDNRKATKTIFDNLVRIHPAAVFLLGDVVSLGYAKNSWTSMDQYLEKFKSEGIAVTAALGNHELMGRPKRGQKRFAAHFPKYVNTGYVEVVDSIAVVILNSNFRSMTSKTNTKQIDWYTKRLKELDEDPSIAFVIVGCHHSPYSNSKRVGSSVGVQKRFVPAFLASKKSKLFLSGHSHNFEHYQREGKNFLVIGGGGGPHQPLRIGTGSLEDMAKDYKPVFHYLTVKRIGKQLQVVSKKLKDDMSGFENGRLVDIGY